MHPVIHILLKNKDKISVKRLNKGQKQIKAVRVGVIETPSHPWQGRVLPLNHTRIYY